MRALVTSSRMPYALGMVRLLADAGMYVSELRPDAVSLEELFLSITGSTADQEVMS